MKIYMQLATITCSLLLSSCAWLTHYNNKETIGQNQAVFFDAKQRAVFKVKKSRPVNNSDPKVLFDGYCAEPSPDAISALAASLGVDLTVTEKGKLGLSSTLAEGVSNIGVRTAAIQALRDFMYRNCEAYALGGISQTGLETLQRRFQSTMVSILAIEQLTGAVQSPPVTIHADSSIGSPEAILELTQKSELAKSQLEEGKKTEEQEKEKADAASGEAVKAQEAIDKHNEEIKSIKSKPAADLTEEEKQKLANSEETLKGLNEELEKKSKRKRGKGKT